jgi:hypothetical protein
MTVDYEVFFVQEPDGSFSPVFRPMLALRLIGAKAANPAINCRLDTGADDVMVPDIEAGFLGVTLDESQRVPIDSLGSGTTAVFETVDLEIRYGPNTWRWSARVGFHDGIRYSYVLGQNGFLQHFTSVFDGKDRRFSLTPNGSFPPHSSSIP